MNYTTIEQSKKLLKLGLNPETADMFWFRDDTEIPRVFPKDMMHDSASVTYPCWSIGALLELLNYPKLYKDRLGNEDVWICESFLEEWGEYRPGDIMETQIDAIYTLICWLLENNYIKKELYDTKRKNKPEDNRNYYYY